MLILKPIVDDLSLKLEILKVNPYLEALRLAKEKREICCHILAYHTAPNTYKDHFDSKAITTRKNYFEKELNDEDLASLMIIVLTSEKTEEIIKHIGLDKERERMAKVMELKRKNDKNSISFNGVSLFGTFIGQLKEMGYSDNEILYEKSYAFLRLMLADKVVSTILTDEERQSLYDGDGGTLMDANDPTATDKIRDYFAQKGISIE